jgi:hypothetical protein
MSRKIRLNLVQLIYYPIISLMGIMGLGFWLRDLIVLEWNITPFIANIIGWVLVVFIILLSLFIIFCIIKMNRIITKFVSTTELERELNLIKSRD